jgi:hypothetical protein
VLFGCAVALALAMPSSLPARVNVPLPPVSVTWHSEPCPDPTALACAQGTHVWLPPDGGRHLRFHELGHVFDYTVMDDAARQAWLAVMGDRREWYAPVDDPPFERFAESYATCAMHKRIRRRYSSDFYRYRPTPSQHRRACRIIRQAYARALSPGIEEGP